jgi:hypothetical protein
MEIQRSYLTEAKNKTPAESLSFDFELTKAKVYSRQVPEGRRALDYVSGNMVDLA